MIFSRADSTADSIPATNCSPHYTFSPSSVARPIASTTNMEQPEEERPFLELEEADPEQNGHKDNPPPPKRNRRLVILWLSLLLLAMSIGRYLTTMVLLLRQKEIICRNFLSTTAETGYDTACLGPGQRPAPQVVEEHDRLVYWDMMFSLLPSLLVALPYGLAADRYGGKSFVVLSVGSIMLSAVFQTVICKCRTCLNEKLEN
jgi:hypothetical protein